MRDVVCHRRLNGTRSVQVNYVEPSGKQRTKGVDISIGVAVAPALSALNANLPKYVTPVCLEEVVFDE